MDVEMCLDAYIKIHIQENKNFIYKNIGTKLILCSTIKDGVYLT